ncbi:hypothetical protein AMAG_10276 [Allomyces macrogynus ATCC 38327]|uniref:Cilia- and flagella-associated protein 58 central coiled coil domain-containing protein n=1 Tax=Allomyces macrogynus (strain ATCC 38327) TaxID=578462 RepID=A0A0L0STZ9_ALLM3|nr:hypothetical protein AMAG_10276 [Allomyces macrogynus ATCC 38327]|eukprot:KNE65997.1 hypothetical protein AMAG_10276 [Allomyces macrogynus ATCC 38327]
MPSAPSPPPPGDRQGSAGTDAPPPPLSATSDPAAPADPAASNSPRTTTIPPSTAPSPKPPAKDDLASDQDSPEDESFVDEDLLNSGLFNIESSSAFKFLDALRAKEQISAARAEELKRKHHSLYQYILMAFEYEKAMIKKSKTLQAEVSKQKMDMDKTGTKVYDDNAEIGELKRELLRCQNEVTLAQEREAKYSKDIEEALITKEGLLEDIEEIRRHKTDMLEPQLIANTKEIKLDLIQRKHQVENLEKDLEEKEQMHENAAKDKERLLAEREKQEIALAKANEMPGKIMKQAEVLRDGIASLVIENVKQGQLGAQLEKDAEKLTKKRRELEEDRAALAAEFEQRKEEMLERERACDDIFREHEQAKLLLTQQEEERQRLELALTTADAKIRADHEALLRCVREKDHLVKVYRKLEGTVNAAVAMVPGARQTHQDVLLALDVAQRDAKHYRTQARTVRREIDVLLHTYLEAERMSAGEKELFAARLEANRALEHEINALARKMEQLERAIVQAKYEREMKARELLRAEARFRKARDDAAHRDMEVQDALKKADEAQSRLTDFASRYDNVKNERNRYVNLIASSQQRAVEMKEKARILRSEIEILRTEIAGKDRALARQRQENTADLSRRDNAKMQANRLMVQYRERRSLIDQQTGRIDTLSTSLSSCAAELATLKSRYEVVVNERNAAGLQYLERNDELCMLYEKCNQQERVMLNGEAELRLLEDRIRSLSRVKGELDRTVRLLRARVPKMHKLLTDYESLRAQVKEAKTQVLELSKIMETPTAERVRDLKGADPAQEELVAKVRKLELRLAQQEEKLLEKDLVLEEIAHLTERLRSQTQLGRTESAEVMGRMNTVARKLSQTARTAMATVAELSMAQALSAALGAEVEGKNALLERVRNAMPVDEPGNYVSAAIAVIGNDPLLAAVPDFDAEWAKLEERRRKRVAQSQHQARKRRTAGEAAIDEAQMCGDWTRLPEFDTPTYLLPTGIKTTALPRPNAYLPSAPEALPVPKPYGGHAPFKPSNERMAATAGGNLKYYRKPVQKPIEI